MPPRLGAAGTAADLTADDIRDTTVGVGPVDADDADRGAPGRSRDDARRGALGRRAGRALAMQGAGIVARFGSQLALARVLGPSAFGAYTYAFNLAQLAAQPADLGASSAVLRFVPEYESKQDWARLRGVLRAAIVVPLAFGCVVAAAGAGLVRVTGSGPVPSQLQLLAVPVIPLIVSLQVTTALTRGFHRVASAYVPPLLVQPLVVTAGVVAASPLFGHEVTTRDAMGMTLASFVVAIAIQLLMVRSARQPHPRPKPTYAPRAWVTVSLPLMLTSVVQQSIQRLDVVMVGLLASPREAGIYAVTFRLAGLASIFQTSMNGVIAPRISELYWSDRRDELERSLLSAIRMILLPSCVAAVVLVAFGRPILALFGESFVAGWPALVVYSLGQLASAGAGPVGWLLSLTGNHRTSTIINVVTALLALIGYLLLIPRFGMVGAAASNAIAVTVNNVWELAFARRRMDLRLSPWRALAAARR